MRDELFTAGFLVFFSLAVYLAAGFGPDFDFFMTLFIDVPMRTTGLYSLLKWTLVLAALAGIGFGFLTQVKDKRLCLGGAAAAGIAMIALLGANSLVLFTAFGLLLGIAISIKDLNHAAGNAVLLAGILLAFATYNFLAVNDKSDAVFDRLAVQLDEMVTKMSGTLNDAAKAQATAMADMLATVQEQTVDATTVRYNQYLASQGLAVIPAAKSAEVKKELIDREALRTQMLGQVQNQKVDTKALIRPLLYDQLKANLPLVGAISMFSAVEAFRSVAGPIAGLFASLLRLLIPVGFSKAADERKD